MYFHLVPPCGVVHWYVFDYEARLYCKFHYYFVQFVVLGCFMVVAYRPSDQIHVLASSSKAQVSVYNYAGSAHLCYFSLICYEFV